MLLAGCGGSDGDIKFTPDPKPAPNLPSPNSQPGKNVYRHLSSYNAKQGAFGGSISNSAPSMDTLSFNGVELPLDLLRKYSSHRINQSCNQIYP